MIKDKVKRPNSYLLIKVFELYLKELRNHLITRRLYKF